MRSNGLGIRLSLAAFLAFSPMALPSAQAEDCVRTVRALSDFSIRGDAWLWWSRAEGQYARDSEPAVGSVLVFKRSGRLNRGHVSLVSRIVDSRTIEVDHTWLDGQGVQRNMRVIDVSGRGDWSKVRVWHEPSDQLGLRTYATYGFILPDGMQPQDRGPRLEYAVAPAGRGLRAKADRLTVAEHAPLTPARKPLLQTASLTRSAPVAATAGAAAAERTTVATVLPAVKPAQRRTETAAPAVRVTARMEVARADAKPAVLPRRKPNQPAANRQVASADR